MRPQPHNLLAFVGAGLVIAGSLTLGLMRVLHGPAATPDMPAPVIAVTPSHENSDSTVADAAPFALWGHDHRGHPLRWDPCAPVAFVLNLDGATVDAERDILLALDLLGSASGLDLVVVGLTDERPRSDRPLVEPAGDGWRWRPVLIAWAQPGEGGLPLTRADRGVALPVAVRDGDREALVTGQVVLNGSRGELVPGFEDRATSIGATILHEIAHVLGLAHVADPAQLMAEDPGSGPVELGQGDLAGLRAIGSATGCLATPSPTVGRGLTAAR